MAFHTTITGFGQTETRRHRNWKGDTWTTGPSEEAIAKKYGPEKQPFGSTTSDVALLAGLGLLVFGVAYVAQKLSPQERV